MTDIRWPAGFSVDPLSKRHNRSAFNSGVDAVDEWLKKRARQAQRKRLSVTRVLGDHSNDVAGFYTLAMGQVSFDDLPHELVRKLPGTLLPILTLAWLGLDREYQGRGLGERLLAQALTDCHRTGEMMPFVAVLLDCLTSQAKSFYTRYDFEQLPGHPMTLMLSWKLLDRMVKG